MDTWNVSKKHQLDQRVENSLTNEQYLNANFKTEKHENKQSIVLIVWTRPVFDALKSLICLVGLGERSSVTPTYHVILI